MAGEFLGVGWAYPFSISETGMIDMSLYDENIRESINIILQTAPGERQMRPDFGCNIISLVFSENNMATAGMAAHYVQEALVKWEPRIEILSVRAVPEHNKEEKLSIYIDYRVIRTNSVFNLVYPFYLTEGVGV